MKRLTNHMRTMYAPAGPRFDKLDAGCYQCDDCDNRGAIKLTDNSRAEVVCTDCYLHRIEERRAAPRTSAAARAMAITRTLEN